MPNDTADDNDNDREPAFNPLEIGTGEDQSLSGREKSSDGPVTVEREAVWEDREGEDSHSLTIGTVGAGTTFDTRCELRADFREESESESVAQPILTDIQEVGEDRADSLREAGYESVDDVVVVVSVAGQSTLTEIEGIDGTCAETIAESANTLLDDQSDGTGAESAGGDE